MEEASNVVVGALVFAIVSAVILTSASCHRTPLELIGLESPVQEETKTETKKSKDKSTNDVFMENIGR